ncbi:MAG: trypsin-like peptidase domain-containing protein [Candidatus Staskawiczbacteria bacterium]|nr:trypsin-like peptidase domain-containing protein [Candidatus Staskawiczbacteria bacterium]
MSLYNLPQYNFSEVKNKSLKIIKNKVFLGALLLVVAGYIIGIYVGITALHYFPSETQAFLKYFETTAPKKEKNNDQSATKPYVSGISYEQAIIDAAKKVSPSVVSIVISKNVPVYEQQLVDPFGNNGSSDNPFGDFFGPFDIQIPQQVQKGTKYQQIGAGSGFIVSADGLVLTNKHVVSDNKADYTVFTNDGQKYPAKVLALDPVQDLAVIKISRHSGIPSNGGTIFQPVTLGDSSGIQIGQTAIAIGNALGQFRNTVSVGVISGLGRTISASDQLGSFSETLEDIIQTDAAINSGNSGGPLLNLRGEVIGINTAMAQGAEAIGFAIPINMAKKDIDQVAKTNKIVYPFLGVRYILVDEQVKEKYNLSVDYGALVLKGSKGELAVTSGSVAEKAGIKEKDVILKVDGEKITTDSPMSKMIQKHNAGDKVTLRILRDGKEQDVIVTLGERSS